MRMVLLFQDFFLMRNSDNFFCSRIDQMIDSGYLPSVLASHSSFELASTERAGGAAVLL
jgi:hypothetical protein